jgi:hypothetical protein
LRGKASSEKNEHEYSEKIRCSIGNVKIEKTMLIDVGTVGQAGKEEKDS